MVFKIKKAGRTVRLNDKLVEAYVSTLEPPILTESPFVIAMKFDFGRYPSEKEMSEEELSRYCEGILAEEVQFSFSLPKLTNFLGSDRKEQLLKATQENRALTLKI